VTAADLALEWWRFYGEARLDELWHLSSKPVRYMLARSMAAGEINALAAGGDPDGANSLLIACQGFALHGTKGPAWQQLEPLRARAFEPIDMDPLIKSMGMFPRVETDLDNYKQVTFYPPDTPPMPWTIDLPHHTVVGFAAVLRGSEDAGELGERVALDPIALWSGEG
jgi:hypothetical protein